MKLEKSTIKCEHERLVDLKDLVPNPKNPNKHSDEQINKISEIIKYQGWRHPIIISKRSGFICAGHARFLAAKLLNLDSVPVDYQNFKDEAEEYSFMVSDNTLAALAALDRDMITFEAEKLPELDIKMLALGETILPPIEDIEIKEKEINEDLEKENMCPSCGFEW